MFIINTRTDVDDSTLTALYCINSILYLAVVATAVLSNGIYNHWCIGIRSIVFCFRATCAYVRQRADIAHRILAGIFCLLCCNLAAEYLNLMNTCCLTLLGRVNWNTESRCAVFLCLHKGLNIVAIPNTPTYRHIVCIDYVLHEIALVTEHCISALMLVRAHPHQWLPFAITNLHITLYASAP